jgi:hypothetical protein
MLTHSEVHELIGSLQTLDIKNDHIHVNDENYNSEITIGLYTLQILQNFNDEVIRLIQGDE